MDKPKPTVLPVKPAQEVKKSESMVLTQREAVFQEVSKILKQEKIVLQPKQPVKAALKDNHMKVIITAIAAGFKTGAIDLKNTDSNKKKLADAKQLESYVIGLVNNWLRRDNRLNGTGDKVQS